MGNDEAGSAAFRAAWKRGRSDSGRPENVRIEGDWAWIEEWEERDEWSNRVTNRDDSSQPEST